MYATSPDLIRLIDNNNWLPIISQKQNKYVVDVYLNNNKKYPNVFNQSYIIKLDSTMKKKNALVLLFPAHPDEHKRVLRTKNHRNCASLGKEINDRLRKCVCVNDNNTVLFAVASQNRIYRFRSLHGTGYIVWAERINQETASNYQNTIAEDVPVFYEMDGEMNIVNVVVFPIHDEFIEERHGQYSLHPISCESVTTEFPINTILFPCEADTRTVMRRKIKTVTDQRADKMTRDLVAKHIIEEMDTSDLPFDVIDDSEDSIVVGTESFLTIDMEQETPRAHVP